MESEWARQNRAGMVTELDHDHVVLWNYDVGSSELKPEHLAGLDQIFETWQVLRLHPSCAMRIEGHTSSSGSERLNRRLSNERAAAVFDNLAARSGGPDRIAPPTGLGSSRPWFEESDGEKLARNRRIEVYFLRPQEEEPAPRKSLTRPAERPAGEASAEGFVNGYIKIKGSIDGVPVPLGKAVLLYPQLELSATVSLDASSPRIAGLEVGPSGIEKVIRERFLGSLDVKTNLSRRTFSVSLLDVPLSPEVELSLLTPEKPLQLNTTWISIPIERWPVYEGVSVTGNADVRIKVGIGPGPGAVVAFGTSAAIVLGTLAGTVGITVGTAKLVEYANERGLSSVKKIGFRDCFALRIAGEATGRYDDAREAAEGWLYGEAATACWDGWNLAQEALDRTPEPRRRAILDALDRRAGGILERLRHELLLKVGGLDSDGPLPTADLERLAADAGTAVHQRATAVTVDDPAAEEGREAVRAILRP